MRRRLALRRPARYLSGAGQDPLCTKEQCHDRARPSLTVVRPAGGPAGDCRTGRCFWRGTRPRLPGADPRAAADSGPCRFRCAGPNCWSGAGDAQPRGRLPRQRTLRTSPGKLGFLPLRRAAAPGCDCRTAPDRGRAIAVRRAAHAVLLVRSLVRHATAIDLVPGRAVAWPGASWVRSEYGGAYRPRIPVAPSATYGAVGFGIAPQPLGHEKIWTGPNSYIYRPIYASTPPGGMSWGVPASTPPAPTPAPAPAPARADTEAETNAGTNAGGRLRCGRCRP